MWAHPHSEDPLRPFVFTHLSSILAVRFLCITILPHLTNCNLYH